MKILEAVIEVPEVTPRLTAWERWVIIRWSDSSRTGYWEQSFLSELVRKSKRKSKGLARRKN